MLFTELNRQIPICLKVLTFLEAEKEQRQNLLVQTYAPSAEGNLCGFQTEDEKKSLFSRRFENRDILEGLKFRIPGAGADGGRQAKALFRAFSAGLVTMSTLCRYVDYVEA